MRRSRVAATFLAVAVCAGASGAQAAAGSGPSGQAVDNETARPKGTEPRLEDPPPEPEVLVAPGHVRHTAIYWLFGFGTPVGIVGFEGVHRFGDWFELAAGFGNGLAAEVEQPHGTFGHALQWAVMPRLRYGSDHNAFTFGVGLSGGEFTSNILCIGCDDEATSVPTYPTYYTLWTNLEIGGEYWSRGGFAVRYYLGLAHGTMPGRATDESLLTLPYFGVGLGYAF